ncbi:hypothetical protein B0T25DRAFT_3286 [Lasiosphaeria hispida]|uniref:Uncharacterized protein n=1 Tax=Lasiosphaeria hispida TaxID=260671 RepID=A0AAJ0MJB4_9PEZI|nr:hypothetical protein B0T25DRAFT_3286 [Lasiosphaeria hispida]
MLREIISRRGTRTGLSLPLRYLLAASCQSCSHSFPDTLPTCVRRVYIHRVTSRLHWVRKLGLDLHGHWSFVLFFLPKVRRPEATSTGPIARPKPVVACKQNPCWGARNVLVPQLGPIPWHERSALS